MKQPNTNSILRNLKKNSDIFCPVMKKACPTTDREMVKMALDTLIDMGYQITSPEGKVIISSN